MSTQSDSELAPSLVFLFAAGAGVAVAALYYNQPILQTIAEALHASPKQIGLVPMLTQLGYACGLALFAPLGDRLDRRRVIVAKTAALTAALLGAAAASSIEQLCAASLAVGLLATVAQDYVPAAATLAPERSRGRIVGRVMTGLLLGILLSRTVSGAAAEHLGWRAVFVCAAVSIALLCIASALRLPRFTPTTSQSYRALLGSLVQLVRDHAALRRAALTQGALGIAFSAFWSTLALALAAPPYRLGSAAAGAFGLAGAAGALSASFAGAFADKRGPNVGIRTGALLVLASFVGMAVWQDSWVVIAVGAVVFDMGIQAASVSHQTIVYSLDPAARSRLNAVLISSIFIGMSVGAAVGSQAFAHWGWTGVTSTGAAAALVALCVHFARFGSQKIHREPVGRGVVSGSRGGEGRA